MIFLRAGIADHCDGVRGEARMTILAADGLSIAFGGVHAVDDVSLAVAPGLVFSIIGPNGAGKTTLFNSTWPLPEQGGAPARTSPLAPERLARRRSSRTFQNLQIFFRMSALENVMVGRHRLEATESSPISCICPRSPGRTGRRAKPRRPRWRVSGWRRWRNARRRPVLWRACASRSPARWRASPRSCCSTSPPPAAIRSRPPSSKPSSAASSATASPWCWSSTTCGW